MKAQLILNSFLPGVTAAVLTTQPTWAATVTVDNSHLGIYKSIFATSKSQEDVSPNTFILVKNTIDNNYPAPFTPLRIAKGNLKPAILNNSEVRVVGKTGVLIKTSGQNQQEQQTEIYGLKTSSHKNLRQALKKASLQKVSSGNIDLPQTRKIAPAIIKKNPDDQIFEKLQQISKGPGAAKLLEVENCSTQEDALKLQNLLSVSATSACQRINSIPNQKLAQPLISPAPVQSIKLSQRPAPLPNSLDPSANPLQYPTKPEEVRVEQTQSITLQQALELARRNNQELQVALLQLERAQAGLKVAQAGLLPTVGLNAQVARQQSATGQLSNELQRDIPPELRRSQDDSPSTAFSGGAQLNYDIYTSGARSARIRQAEEQLRLQELDVERLSEEIRLNVATEYYNLQQTDEQVRISQAAVVNAEASLRDARALEEAGVGTRFDSLRTQVNLANAQQTLTNARSQQRIARRQLATRLNIAQSATIAAADPVRLAGLWNQNLENSIVLAYQNRPELQQQLAQRNINEQQRRQALAQLGPQVSLVANYELLDRFNDSVGLTDGYSVALRANLNLFDGGASRAQAAQAKADIQISETQFSQQRNQIRFQVERAYSELQSNLENVQTSEAALNQARESLRLARLRFQAGVGTQLEVIDAENALTQAEGNRINAILDYNRALANLQRSVTSRGLR